MNDASGSWWRKWDLHFHTPKSHDYQNKSLSPTDVVNGLVQANVEVVAVTDHHVLDVPFIQEMQEVAADALTALPGIELASNLGGTEGVHFIAVFPEDSDLSHISAELMAKLDLAQKRKDGIAQESLYVEFPTAAKVIQELRGIVTIHGHGKAANYETISSRLKFKQQQKTDLLREYVDIIEVGGVDHVAPYSKKIFPTIGFSLPIIVGSDNHRADVYAAPVPCWIKADPTFNGLRMAIREPAGRFWLGEMPPTLDRVKKNKTRYIKSIRFTPRPSMPSGEVWLQGEVPLNPGLVAIIGNKGSGKSALSDCLGLLGSCSTSEAFSFLDDKRFRDPKTGRAQHVEATLHWHDGEPRTRLLEEGIDPDEPERVKYLPQNFVEKVCNELAMPGGGEFERELKKVVFSKVRFADRLGKRSLDELVQFRTQELRKEADSVAVGLQNLAAERDRLEGRLDPSVRSGLQKRIDQLKEEIKSHESTKPAEVKPPIADGTSTPEAKASLEQLSKLKNDRAKIGEDIKTTEASIVSEQLRAATAKKLLDKLDNLRSEFDRRIEELATDAESLGLDAAKLASLTIDKAVVEHVRNDALQKRDAASARIDADAPEGLKENGKLLDEQIKALQVRLDRPNQEYQGYLERLGAWQTTLTKLTGTPDDADSLQGLETELTALDGVPAKIQVIQTEQELIAAEIHKSRVAEAGVFTELYGPVQKFISDHRLAKDQLKLEFTVDLVQEGFEDNLLSHLNQNRTGSFYGVEEGRARAGALAAPVDWSKWDEVKLFLESVVEHLHTDKRPGFDGTVLLKGQIGKGKTTADLYAWLYGLGFLKPRYLLRWDGKDVAQLSPGERGTLLLIFYLLIDGSDLPLIIDQPEANLDNVTVTKKLVDCIRDARERRQVVIVTHNPNLAVVCDADQIIHATMDKGAGNRITYTSGALEHPVMNRFAIDVLEGGRPPFNKRDDTYRVAGE